MGISRTVLLFLLLSQVSLASAQEVDYRVEVVATGLGVPWGIAFVDAETLLITEREQKRVSSFK